MPLTLAFSINNSTFRLLCLWMVSVNVMTFYYFCLVCLNFVFHNRLGFFIEQISNVRLQPQTFTFCVRTPLLPGVILLVDHHIPVEKKS